MSQHEVGQGQPYSTHAAILSIRNSSGPSTKSRLWSGTWVTTTFSASSCPMLYTEYSMLKFFCSTSMSSRYFCKAVGAAMRRGSSKNGPCAAPCGTRGAHDRTRLPSSRSNTMRRRRAPGNQSTTALAKLALNGTSGTHQVIAASSCFLHMCSCDCCVLPGLFRSCSHVCLPDWQMGCGSVGTDGSNHIRSLTLYPSW